MKRVKYVLFILIAIISGTGCKKFSELAADPNKPSQGIPSTIFTGVSARLLASILFLAMKCAPPNTWLVIIASSQMRPTSGPRLIIGLTTIY